MTYKNKYEKIFEISKHIIEGTGVDGIVGTISINSDDGTARIIRVSISGSFCDSRRMDKNQIDTIFDMIAKISVENMQFNNKVYNSSNTKNCYSYDDFMNILANKLTRAKEKRIGFK